jgi:hypothetical protein
MRISDLLKGGMSFVEVGWHHGNNESSILSIVLNSLHPKHVQVFLNCSLLGTIDLRIPRTFINWSLVSISPYCKNDLPF